MGHDDKHKATHAIAGDDAIVASDLGNDSGVTGATIKAALDQLDSDISAEEIWDHAAGIISPQTASDHTLDFSGATGSDITIKIPAAKKLLVNDGTNDVLYAADGGIGIFPAGGFGNISFNEGGNAFAIASNSGGPSFEITVNSNTNMAWRGGQGGITLGDSASGIFGNVCKFENDNAGGAILQVTAGEGAHVNDGTNNVAILNAGGLDMSESGSNSILRLNHYAQITQPILANNGEMTVWEDTDDSNRSYLIIRTNGVDRKVEVTSP